jgi:catechol 2,3-dioxygenase-like lactoylglutathione lyase family enzyme
MVAIESLAHFSISVSGIARAAKFCTEVLGCRNLATVPHGDMVFPDAAGVCLILIKREPPISRVREDNGDAQHSFAVAHEEYPALEHLHAHGVDVTFEEDRQGGMLNGPRVYFHDSDDTVLEFIDLTSYSRVGA